MKELKYFCENGIQYIECECRYCKTVNILRFIGAGQYKCCKCKNPFWIQKKKVSG